MTTSDPAEGWRSKPKAIAEFATGLTNHFQIGGPIARKRLPKIVISAKSP